MKDFFKNEDEAACHQQDSISRVVICDSRRGFEFSRQNSSLSWAFSRQNKKIKTIGIINASVTVK